MRRSVVLLACLTMLLAACGQGPRPELSGGPASVLRATDGDGSLFNPYKLTQLGVEYTLYKPALWEFGPRALVVYAHGYLSPIAGPASAPPPDLVEEFAGQGLQEFVGGLMQSGVAVAWSTSNSRRGYAVEEGVKQTAGVRAVWDSVIGVSPEHTYVAGHSLGGLVALSLAEHDADRFDGALALCAPLAGSQRQTDYIVNLRLVFDTLFGTLDLASGKIVSPLGGNVLHPVVLTQEELAAAVTQASALKPDMVPLMAVAAANGERLLQAETPDQLGPALIGALRYNVGGAKGVDGAPDVSGSSDLLARAGGSPFDPSEFTYSILGLPPIPLIVNTVGLDPVSQSARRYLTKFYAPTFRPKIPMITMHNRLDPDVPFTHEVEYGMRAAGSLNLAQRPPQTLAASFGHCAFTPQEHVEALSVLALWVEAGIHPPF
jgi:pimeloyl-ACP methyl ester carboxylesterase